MRAKLLYELVCPRSHSVSHEVNSNRFCLTYFIKLHFHCIFCISFHSYSHFLFIITMCLYLWLILFAYKRVVNRKKINIQFNNLYKSKFKSSYLVLIEQSPRPDCLHNHRSGRLRRRPRCQPHRPGPWKPRYPPR